jgi:predicted permease
VRLLTEARERLRALFFRAQQERELDEEVRSHLAMEIEANLRRGLDPAEARRQAAITFGAVERVKEEVRAARSLWLAEDLARDLKYSARRLGRAPLTPLLIIGSLAIGIALTSAMFSTLDALLLRPLPYKEADRIVRVWSNDPEAAQYRRGFSASSLEQMREKSRGVELAAFVAGGLNLAGPEMPERVAGLRVTGNFLRVLELPPLLGRASFSDGDLEDGAGLVAVISEGLWLRAFGGDRDVPGKVLLLDGQPHTVIGVVGNESLFPHRGVDIYTPLSPTAAALHDNTELSVIGRLSTEYSIETAAAELNRIGTGPAASRAGQDRTVVTVQRLDRVMFNQAFRTGAAICFVAVLFVLLIACSNAANLLLARAATRQHEIALHAALGASRSRLIRLLLTEAVVLALAGGAIGVLLAYWGIQGLISIMPADVPMVHRIALDDRALLFTLGISLLAGIASGAGPALHGTRRGLASVPQGAGRWGTGDGTPATRMRSAIVIGQMALALVLLIGSGLLIKGYNRAMDTDLGFETDRLLTMRVSLPELERYDEAQTVEILSELEAELGAMGGVEGVAVADALPTTRWGRSVSYVTADSRDRQSAAELRSVAPGFFDALGINVTRGRTFTDHDRAGDPPVVVINDFLARTHWADQSPVGEYIEFNGRVSRIVGVVADINEWGAAAPPPLTIYVPLAQLPAASIALAVRSELPAQSLLPRIREAVGRVDPSLSLAEVATMDRLIRESQPRNRLMVRVLGIFAAVAALLAVMGVYGVMAYNVTRRRSEVGIRAALGARTSDILRLMLAHGATLAGIGVFVGVTAALGVTRFLAAFLNGVSPFDVVVFGGVAGLLFSVAIAACVIPALRAARVSPVTALRSE